jgi:DNA polymerase-3 subunit epsilon
LQAVRATHTAPAAQWHVFDRWCYLGSVSDIEAVQALIQNAERRFDIDAFRLLQTWMGEGRVSLLGV